MLKWRRDTQLCEGWQNFHSKSQFGHFAWQWRTSKNQFKTEDVWHKTTRGWPCPSGTTAPSQQVGPQQHEAMIGPQPLEAPINNSITQLVPSHIEKDFGHVLTKLTTTLSILMVKKVIMPGNLNRERGESQWGSAGCASYTLCYFRYIVCKCLWTDGFANKDLKRLAKSGAHCSKIEMNTGMWQWWYSSQHGVSCKTHFKR